MSEVVSADVFGGPVVVKLGGEDVEFPRLLLSTGYEAVASRAKAEVTAQIAAIADASKLQGIERATFVKNNVPRFATPDLVEAYLSTKEGIEHVLRASLTKAGKSEEATVAVLGRLGFFEAQEVALQVVCFLKPRKPADGPGDAGQPPAA